MSGSNRLAVRVGGYALATRDHEGSLEILLTRCGPDARFPGQWALPGGGIEWGEHPRDTVVREVAEETGLQVRLVAPLDAIEYWFVQGGARIHKTVHYWLMEPVGGDLERHDHEFDEVRWVPLGEAPALLTFETERALVARAAAAAGPRPDGQA